MKKKRTNAGQSIIEVLIAIAVVGSVLTAIAGAMTYSLKSTSEGKFRTYAANKAQEALEVFRRERAVKGWEVFDAAVSSLPAEVCLEDLPTSAQGIESLAGGTCDTFSDIGADFTRTAAITTSGSGQNRVLRVDVYMTWTDAGKTHEVTATQEFKPYQR